MDVMLIGAPVESGNPYAGCACGPASLRASGLAQALRQLEHHVTDSGDVARGQVHALQHTNSAIKNLGDIASWTKAIAETAAEVPADVMPIFLGGDHSISAGSVSGLAKRAKKQGRPLFALWLDAHADYQTLDTTESGNLHGVPLAYATGRPGFENWFPDPVAVIDPRHVCAIGLRSVDPAERLALLETQVIAHDMRAIDENGISPLLKDFLQQVSDANGLLHVSFDVDFLDPGIAPAVGTTVPGGATYREAHLVMEMLSDSGLVTSLDLVELNPFLDERSKTAALLVELTASLMGKRIMDKPTRSYHL
jgi:arginase